MRRYYRVKQEGESPAPSSSSPFAVFCREDPSFPTSRSPTLSFSSPPEQPHPVNGKAECRVLVHPNRWAPVPCRQIGALAAQRMSRPEVLRRRGRGHRTVLMVMSRRQEPLSTIFTKEVCLSFVWFCEVSWTRGGRAAGGGGGNVTPLALPH